MVAIGVGWQYTALWLAERWIAAYPRIPDIVMDRLPRVEFGIAGELFFLTLLLTCLRFFRWSVAETQKVLTAIGLWYFVRGWFALFLPIGPPLNAVAPSARLNLWGFANHAYFPGGHVGLLTILTLYLRPPVRRWMWLGVALFAAGTLLAKNHYTADSIAGWLLGYTVVTVVNQWLPKNTAKVME